MQKKLIALAVVAAFSAPAFADVTVYGIVDAAVASVSSTGTKSDMLALSGGLSSSRIGVTSAEDLDNGMKAVVKVEYSLDAQQSDGVGAARQEMLALAGGFGTVATGYLQTTGYDWAVKFDPTSGSAVSPLQSMTKGQFLVGSAAVAARAPRALAYISPDLGGVVVAVNYTTSFDNVYGNLTLPSGTTAGLKTTATLVSATYTGGPLAVGGVYAGTSNDSTGAVKRTDVALGGSYDLGVAKLLATYQTTKTDASGDAGNTNKAMSFGVVAPVGPGAVAFSYAKNTIATTTADDNGSGMTLAYLQGLSKTTTAYVAYHKVSNSNATAAYGVAANLVTPATNGGSATLIAVGLNKKF
ncbi:MAG: porin [Nitrosomonadales bacterium]|nr:porin [Nitrosomonadales bacterium]